MRWIEDSPVHCEVMGLTLLPARRRRCPVYRAVALLLALLAHLAVMASPMHAQAMVAGAPLRHASHETSSAPLSDIPDYSHWDACGLEATLPATHTTFTASSDILLYTVRHTPLLDLAPICPATEPRSPPPADQQTLLQVFRL
ncbi:MAG TPA: hypothetical protein VHX16_10845 [Chloroflexota bacterium]|jgi:hypothetical protein|nr:hypothetical protein [Chloroflexota bacterium]